MTTGDKVLAALEAFDLKPAGNGQYRANSPLRPGSNSHAFTVTVDTSGEHGAYHDKVTGEFGSLYTLAEFLKIEVPRREATETKRRYENMADYARAHGITEDVLKAAGWLECTYLDVDHGKERPALSIPTSTGLRYRFLDGEKPVYRSPSGYKNCWYGLRKAVGKARETGQALVICNGAPSVVVAQHYGVAACALSGGGQKMPVDLLAELRSVWTGDIVIAMDCDQEGQIATRQYHDQLPTAAIVDLGLTLKGDLADFCTLYTDDSVSELAKRAVKFEVYEEKLDVKALADRLAELAALRKAEADAKEAGLNELLDKTQHEIDLLRQKSQPESVRSFAEVTAANRLRLEAQMKTPGQVGGLQTYLRQLDRTIGNWQGGRVHVIYGDTNMGKSSLAVSIVAPFILQGAGMIVSTESPPGAYLDKLVACICKIPSDCISEGRLTPEQYQRVRNVYRQLEGMNCHMFDAGSPTPYALSAAVREGVRKYGYKWVLVDSMSKMKIPGSDDIYNTTRVVADALQDLARETNVAIVATCQVGRNLKERANKTPLPNDALGAGTVEQNADVILSLYRHDHYVKLGTAKPDDRFPENSALVRVIKHRWKDALNVGVMLTFAGGAGLYELETKSEELEF